MLVDHGRAWYPGGAGREQFAVIPGFTLTSNVASSVATSISPQEVASAQAPWREARGELSYTIQNVRGDQVV